MTDTGHAACRECSSFRARRRRQAARFLAQVLGVRRSRDVVISAVIVFPWLFTLFMSLQDWKIGGGAEFVGARELVTLANEPRFRESMRHHVLFHRRWPSSLPLILGTAAALIFHREFPCRGVLRAIFMMPMMATPVAVALVWTMMFHPQLGVLNYLCRSSACRRRCGSIRRRLVIPSLVLVEVWHWTPLVMLIVLGGLAALPKEPYESARDRRREGMAAVPLHHAAAGAGRSSWSR